MQKLQWQILSAMILLLSACGSNQQTPEQTPENIILLISDGWSYNHILATDYFSFGESGHQAYDSFRVKYAMSTFSGQGASYEPDSAWADFNYSKRKATDSAAASTAMATGHKTYNGAIGVDTTQHALRNIIDLFESRGKATGLVTTVQLSHATPAGMVAHDSSRNHYAAIANEMIWESALDVLIGAGHPFYNDNGEVASDTIYKFVGGKATWQALLNTRAGGDADGDGNADPWAFIDKREEFQKLGQGETPKRLLAVPRVHSTLQQKRSGNTMAAPFEVPLIPSVPSLAEMSRVALNVLDNDPDGFFMMIEGGAVDWASHNNESGRMIEEQVDFNQAVNAVVEWVHQNSNWDETLVIVTGDHECGYLTGPGSGNQLQVDGSVKGVWQPIVNHGKANLPGMEWHSDSHTNSLIPFFAHGAGSAGVHQYADQVDPVRGKYIDNTAIAKVIFHLLEANE